MKRILSVFFALTLILILSIPTIAYNEDSEFKCCFDCNDFSYHFANLPIEPEDAHEESASQAHPGCWIFGCDWGEWRLLIYEIRYGGHWYCVYTFRSYWISCSRCRQIGFYDRRIAVHVNCDFVRITSNTYRCQRCGRTIMSLGADLYPSRFPKSSFAFV